MGLTLDWLTITFVQNIGFFNEDPSASVKVIALIVGSAPLKFLLYIICT